MCHRLFRVKFSVILVKGKVVFTNILKIFGKFLGSLVVWAVT